MSYKVKSLTQAQIDKLPKVIRDEYDQLKEDSLNFDSELAAVFKENDELVYTYAISALQAQEKAKPAAKPKAEKPVEKESYESWEENIMIFLMEGVTDGDRGDAAGILQANEFKLQQSWGKGLNAKDTYKLIAPTKSPKPKSVKPSNAPLATISGVSIYQYKNGKLALSKEAKPWGGILISEMRGQYQPAVKFEGKKGFYIVDATLEEISKVLGKKPETKLKVVPKDAPNTKGTYLERVKPIIAELAQADPNMTHDEVLNWANRIQKVRKDSAVVNDDNRKASSVLEPTYTNLLRWAVSPGRYDIQGVDIAKAAKVTVVARVNKKSFMQKLGIRGF